MKLKRLGVSFALAVAAVGILIVMIKLILLYPQFVSFTLFFTALWIGAYQIVKSLGD